MTINPPEMHDRPGKEWLQDWDPENEETWDKALAWRTLSITTVTLTLAFASWFIASALAPKLTNLGFDYATAFAPISQVVLFPLILVVPAEHPVKTVKELVEWAKATDTRAARWLLALVALSTVGMMLVPVLAPTSFDQTLLMAGEIDRLLAESDYVILCVPLNADTLGMMAAPQFARMKPGSLLINVARGSSSSALGAASFRILKTVAKSSASSAMSSNVKVYGAVVNAESCVYDATRDLIVVINRGVNQDQVPNDAFVSLLNHDGSVYTAAWIGATTSRLPHDQRQATPGGRHGGPAIRRSRPRLVPGAVPPDEVPEPGERRRAAIERVVLEAGGECRDTGEFVAENALRGRWRMRCASGDVRVAITLSPTVPAKVQALTVVPWARERGLEAAAVCR